MCAHLCKASQTAFLLESIYGYVESVMKQTEAPVLCRLYPTHSLVHSTARIGVAKAEQIQCAAHVMATLSLNHANAKRAILSKSVNANGWSRLHVIRGGICGHVKEGKVG